MSQLKIRMLAVSFSLILTSCNNDLTRDFAAQRIAPNVEGKLVGQETIELSFYIDCWVPNEQALATLAGQYKTGVRRLPGFLEKVSRQNLISNVTPAAFLVSSTKGYIYSDCFGADMTPKNNFNGYPSNFLNLQAGAFKVELSEDAKKDILRTDSKPMFVGYAYANSKAISTSVTLALSKQHFIGVSGITEVSKNTRLVSFSYSIVPTETGKKLGNLREEQRAGQAAFVLYDDGWRLQSLDR